MPDLTGFSHLALTISDLDRSKPWYVDVLGWQPMFEDTDESGIRFALSLVVSSSMIKLVSALPGVRIGRLAPRLTASNESSASPPLTSSSSRGRSICAPPPATPRSPPATGPA